MGCDVASLDTWFLTFRDDEVLIFKGRYFRNQNFIPKEIKGRLNSENCCCSSVQNFCIPIRQLKIKKYRTINLPAILYYGCQTWFLTLREEHSRSRVFESGVLRRLFVCERKEVTVRWKKIA